MRTIQMPRFGRPRHVLVIAAMLLIVASVAIRFISPEPPLTGHATAVDGDTLRLNGQRIRILGIDAPELAQTCADASGATWQCGAAATTNMAALLRSGDIVCRPHGRDRYRRVLAACTVGGIDLGMTMVGEGLAVADGDYFDQEATAREERVGIWQGTFTQPVQWRRQHAGEDRGSGLLEVITGWFR